MSVAEGAGMHVMREVGEVLVQALSDLHVLRHQIAGAGPEEAEDLLEDTLFRAEASLRSQAQVVAGVLKKDSMVDEVMKRRGRGRTQREARLEKEMASRHDLLADPSKKASQAYIRRRYGLPQANSSAPQPAGLPRQTGKLVSSGIAKPSIVPKEFREDPSAKLDPAFLDAERGKGAFNLISKGIVAATGRELEDVLLEGGEFMTTARTTMHSHDDQFRREVPQSSTRGGGGGKKAAHTSARKATGGTSGPPSPLRRENWVPSGDRSGETETETETETEQNVDLGQSQCRVRPRLSAVNVGDDSHIEEAASDDPRGYNQLLDDLSLHRFYIRHGKRLSGTPEFTSFYRVAVGLWNQIDVIICTLEKICKLCNFNLALIDGKKVAELAEQALRDPDFGLEMRDLFPCFVEDKIRLHLMTSDARNGPEGRAACRIQSLFRGHAARRRYKELKRRDAAVRPIQGFWKSIMLRRRMIRRIMNTRATREETFVELQRKFKRDWSKMQRTRHVLIHVPSFSVDMSQRTHIPHLEVRQNSQLSRLCGLENPLIDIIYVAPYPLGPDIESYYHKLLDAGGVKKAGRRYRIIYPENFSKLPGHTSLTNCLLCSPKAMRRIEMFMQGRQAYIVPGTVGPEEIDLSVALGVPLLGGHPEVVQKLALKSYAKEIFGKADISAAGGACVAPGSSPAQVQECLAQVIFENRFSERWLLKIDNESGGRGHAHLAVNSLKPLAAFLDNVSERVGAGEDVPTEEAVAFLLEILEEGAEKAVTVLTDLGGGWQGYLERFAERGGVVEPCPNWAIGSPSANVFISPNGCIDVLSTHEQIFTDSYRFIGAAFHQSSVPHAVFQDAALTVARACANEGLIGYLGVDFLAFRHEGKLKLQAVEINPRMTPTQSSFELFRFVTGCGTFNARSGTYIVPAAVDKKNDSGTSTKAALDDNLLSIVARRRYYVMNDFLAHPGLKIQQYTSFFNRCRFAGVFFDMNSNAGTVFNLLDSFSSGVLGAIAISHNPIHAFLELANALDFVISLVPNSSYLSGEEDTLSRAHQTVKFLTSRMRPPPAS